MCVSQIKNDKSSLNMFLINQNVLVNENMSCFPTTNSLFIYKTCKVICMLAILLP